MITTDKINLTVLGGGREIGANCYLISWGRYRIILDCGFDVTRIGYDAVPKFELLNGDVDAAIITHAHIDHSGSLPILLDNYLFKQNRVFVTPPSRDLIPIMLMDSSKKQDRTPLMENTKHSFRWSLDRVSVGDLMSREGVFAVRKFNEPFEVVPGISGLFFPAGHILGSAGVVLSDGRYTVVYTGDVATVDQASIKACEPPNFDKVDCLLIESTRGSIETPEGLTRRSEYTRLAKEIQATLDRKGHVLMPSFALGKSQELMVMLSKMKRQGLIDVEAPVFHHKGLTDFITKKYMKLLDYLNGVTEESLNETSERVNAFNEDDTFKPIAEMTDKPSIFVFTSGMVSKGSPSARLAEEIISSENNSILFTGYLAPEEFGYELAEAETGDFLEPERKRHRKVQVVCPHRYRFALSSHSDRNDLLGLANHFNPDRTIWIHGEATSTEWLSQAWSEQNARKITLQPSTGETIVLRQGKTNR